MVSCLHIAQLSFSWTESEIYLGYFQFVEVMLAPRLDI
jgi:hypothetical protein